MTYLKKQNKPRASWSHISLSFFHETFDNTRYTPVFFPPNYSTNKIFHTTIFRKAEMLFYYSMFLIVALLDIGQTLMKKSDERRFYTVLVLCMLCTRTEPQFKATCIKGVKNGGTPNYRTTTGTQ